MTNPDELERLARAATPGPWWTRNPTHIVVMAADQHITPTGVILNLRTEIVRTVSGTSNGSRAANAAFIAAANPATILALLSANREMGEALEELTDVFAHEGECSTGRFDRLAEMFYRDTRMMAPGKDRGLGGPDQPDGAELRAIYDAWFAAKVTRARSALTTQRGDGE